MKLNVLVLIALCGFLSKQCLYCSDTYNFTPIPDPIEYLNTLIAEYSTEIGPEPAQIIEHLRKISAQITSDRTDKENGGPKLPKSEKRAAYKKAHKKK